VEHAFIDWGEFILAPEFAHYRISAHVCEEKTEWQTNRRSAWPTPLGE